MKSYRACVTKILILIDLLTVDYRYVIAKGYKDRKSSTYSDLLDRSDERGLQD
jgi:hypothetical protein